jgi:deoxyhypusine synthase
MPPVRSFIEEHFLHFNSRELVAAAHGWERHLERGGEMMLTLAGAMSTARVGRLLGRMMRAGKVHAISCTGANLEEDLFNLFAGPEYEVVPDWRALSAEQERALYDRGMNRVTDTCIPETVMRELEARLVALWSRACEEDERLFPSEYLFRLLDEPGIEEKFARDRSESWVLAAKETGVPVYTPGWEDSTTGNLFAGAVFRGTVPHHQCVRTGTEQMEHLMRWYLEHSAGRGTPDRPSVGFFQVGGGIAGDFPICAVPCLIQDLKRDDVPFWGYFAQISDAVTSYGGYSGALPNEKITWGKLGVDTPKFMIQSDASIVLPLIFAILLEA